MLQEVINNDLNILFSSVLRYADAFNNSTTPSWTGNISSWTWKQYGDYEKTYVFGYDNLDRLVSTSQYNNTILENKYGEVVVYDKNGNITSLGRRNGFANTSTIYYSYSGNKRNAWDYDANGNVTSTNPGATNPVAVGYNILNLPAKASQSGSFDTTVLYLADGTKLAVLDDNSSAGTLYYGPFRVSGADYSVMDVKVAGGRAVNAGCGFAMH